jgi:ABC-type glycerol-3-phosphate transport system substrate-binding protein
MRKMILVILTLLAMGMVMSACKNKQVESGPVIINFHTATESRRDAEPLANAFNAINPNIQVRLNYTPNDEYDDKIKILVAASNEVDAFWIRNPAPVQQYIANNALKDLTPYITESGLDVSSIMDSTLKGATKDGKYYGLPHTGSCWMVFYNKDLFDARGIPYPVNLTWEQYLTLANELTYTEGGKKYWGGLCPPWVYNLGAAAGSEYLTAPEPLPLTRQYAEVLNRMYNTDHSHPNIGEMSVGTFDVYPFFAAGNVYMMINGDWTFSLLEAPFNYGAAPLPRFPSIRQGSSAGSVGFYAVSARSAHPKEAYQFIEWALTSSEGTAIIGNSMAIPAYPSRTAQENYQRLVKVPGVEYRFSSIINQEQTTEPYYGALGDAFRQEIELYLLNEQTLDRAFNNFYNLRREILNNYH